MSNAAAMASPRPETIRKYTPTLPAVVLTSDQSVKANNHELSAQKINIMDKIQEYSPLAYSLTMRHAGENSGLRMCRRARDTSVAMEAIIVNRAVVRVDICFSLFDHAE